MKYFNAPFIIRILPRVAKSDNNRTILYKISVVTITFLIYTSYHISRKPLSIVKSVLHGNCSGDICHDGWEPFDQSNSEALFGTLDYTYLFASTIGTYMSGFIVERMNLRLFLSVSMIFAGLSTSAFGIGYFAHIHWFTYYVVVQVIAGLLTSTGWPSVVECMSNWFGKKRRGLLLTTWNTHTSLGNILGSVIAGIWVEPAWGWSFVVPGLIIAVLGVIIYFILVTEPSQVGISVADQSPQTITEESRLFDNKKDVMNEESKKAIGICKALKTPGVVEYSLALFCSKLVSYTLLFWLPHYIHQTSNYNAELSADLSTLFDVGGIAGGILAGYILDETETAAISCSVMLALSIPALEIYRIYGTQSYAMTVVMLIITGLLVNGPYALIATVMPAELSHHHSLLNTRSVATLASITDGTGSLGSAIGPLLTGLLVPYGWEYVFYMLMAASAAGIVCLLRLVYYEVKKLIKKRKHFCYKITEKDPPRQ